MKVLLVINSLAVGGAEKLLVESIPKLFEKGIEVELLLLNGKEHPFFTELVEKKCCKIKTFGKSNVYNPILIFKIIPFLKRADVVHVHLFPSLYWVALAKFLMFSRTKLLFTEHSTSNKRRVNVLYRTIDRFIYRRYKNIIAISTEVKLHLKKHLRIKNSKFRTIYNGVDFSKIYNSAPAERAEFTSDPEEKLIIQIARFTSQKDHETLIKSIPFIKYPVKLLLVGVGAEMAKMKDLVNTLEIEDKVSFLGIRSDVPELLKMADLAVLSSNHEGQSLFGIEAMASGTPLVASKVLGLATLVYGAGVLFTHRDEIDLANKVNYLFSNDAYYKEIVDSCLKRAKKFSLDKMVDQHIQLYKEVCQN